MFSVLYIWENDIHQIGPFKTKEEADAAAVSAQKRGDFSVEDQDVYLLTPEHKMIWYREYDFPADAE